MRIVITGSAGSLARDVISGLLESGHHIHGIDRISAAEVSTGPEATPRSGKYTYHQLDLLTAARHEIVKEFSGADAIIHLAGIPLEDSWENLAPANIDGTQLVCSTAVESGVKRVVLASSIHATGLTPIPTSGDLLKATIAPNPNTLYGASKVAVEALGQYFSQQHGLEVVILRICSRMTKPETARHLSTWLSPQDAVRLCEAAVSGAIFANHWTVWGVSDNTRTWFDQSAGNALGFIPQDNAEAYAARIEAQEKDVSGTYTTIGGEFSTKTPPSMRKGAQI